jgi:hypothetical protein
MARIDAQNELSDAQAVTVTALSTNVIDMNVAAPQYAGGEDLFVEATVNTAFAGGTSIQAIVYTDDTVTVNNGEAIHTPAAVLTASATKGANLVRVNLKGLALQQYVGIYYTVVGTMSAGKVDAYLTKSIYAKASNLS